VRAIAFYLPQFHPIPENDAWWGKGFTEWTNVTRARPAFPGHVQPDLPADLGFYDLRLPEVRAQQADLARQYGIHGFCYYYYWFNGKKLLDRPLREVVESGQPDFPFCICWANESWTRRWDGAEHAVLMQQVDTPEAYRAFLDDVLPILRDPRYIRVDGAPVLLVYRVGRMPDPSSVAASWREQARAVGLPGLHLVAVHSHDPKLDPRPHGFDAAVEFPPSPWDVPTINARVDGLSPDFAGAIFDYRDLARKAIERPVPDFRWYRSVMTAWDNTPRRGPQAYLFRHSSPREYERWLQAAVRFTEAHRPPGERLVFINAWNEWAEGAHLEPDQLHGHAWLQATQRALSGPRDARALLRSLRAQEGLAPEIGRRLDEVAEALDGPGTVAAPDRPAPPSTAFAGAPPRELEKTPMAEGGVARLESLRGIPVPARFQVSRQEPIDIAGWAFVPGLRPAKSWLALCSPGGKLAFFAPLPARTARDDVAFQNRQVDWRCTVLSGFSATFDWSAVAAGEYQVACVQSDGQQAAVALADHAVIVS
jgi:hypothetical protein